MEDQIIVYDYNDDILDLYAAAMPSALVMARTKTKSEIEDKLARHSPDIFHLDVSYNSGSIAEKFDALKLPTWLNLIGEIDENLVNGDGSLFDEQISYRPDMVHTDHPSRVVAKLRARGLHPSELDIERAAQCE